MIINYMYPDTPNTLICKKQNRITTNINIISVMVQNEYRISIL